MNFSCRLSSHFSDYFPVLISSLFSALENTQTKSLWKCNVNSDVPRVKRKCHFGNNRNMLVGFNTGYEKSDLEIYIPNGEKIPIFKLHWMHTIYKIQRKIRQNDSNTLQQATTICLSYNLELFLSPFSAKTSYAMWKGLLSLLSLIILYDFFFLCNLIPRNDERKDSSHKQSNKLSSIQSCTIISY